MLSIFSSTWFWVVVGLLLILVWIFTLRDILKGGFRMGALEKYLWIIVILVFPFLGTIFYLIKRSSRKIKR